MKHDVVQDLKNWLGTPEVIYDGSKAKHEPTRGTTAEEQLRPPHTAADATPEQGKPPGTRTDHRATRL